MADEELVEQQLEMTDIHLPQWERVILIPELMNSVSDLCQRMMLLSVHRSCASPDGETMRSALVLSRSGRQRTASGIWS